MFLAASNRARRLLCLSHIRRVRLEELKRGREDVKTLLADLSQLETMDFDCMEEIGRTMELFDRNEVGMIVRVIPDSRKDIGLNILTLFHYPRHPQVVTCRTMMEAAGLLAL